MATVPLYQKPRVKVSIDRNPIYSPGCYPYTTKLAYEQGRFTMDGTICCEHTTVGPKNAAFARNVRSMTSSPPIPVSLDLKLIAKSTYLQFADYVICEIDEKPDLTIIGCMVYETNNNLTAGGSTIEGVFKFNGIIDRVCHLPDEITIDGHKYRRVD